MATKAYETTPIFNSTASTIFTLTKLTGENLAKTGAVILVELNRMRKINYALYCKTLKTRTIRTNMFNVFL